MLADALCTLAAAPAHSMKQCTTQSQTNNVTSCGGAVVRSRKAMGMVFDITTVRAGHAHGRCRQGSVNLLWVSNPNP
jgi:hypothetical protein